MSKLRNKPTELKSNVWIKEQYANPKYCMLEDCCNEITPYKGAGQDVLCAKHQEECSEYGGMGKPDRPHTFYRNWECTNCGYDPRKDEVRFGHVEDPFVRNRAMRGVMHGDHIHLKSQGGNDTEDNINTLCVLCHMAKTYIEGDFKSNKKGG